MPTPKSRGLAVTGRVRLGAVDQRNAQRERLRAATKSLLSDATRGEQYATSVADAIAGLGSAQLRELVMTLWTELARKENRGHRRRADLPKQPE